MGGRSTHDARGGYYGLLATVVMFTISALSQRTSLTPESSSLYAGPAWVMLGLIFAVALTGFRMARHGEAARR